LETRWAHRPETCVPLSVLLKRIARGFNYGLALGAAVGFAGGRDGEFGAGGAVGKTLIVGGAFAGEPNLDGETTDGVCAFADFKNIRSNWLASIAA
jgi:hypothetical protein